MGKLNTGFWTVWAVHSWGSLEPKEEGSWTLDGQAQWKGSCCYLSSTGQICWSCNKACASLEILKKIGQNPEMCCQTTTIFGGMSQSVEGKENMHPGLGVGGVALGKQPAARGEEACWKWFLIASSAKPPLCFQLSSGRTCLGSFLLQNVC